MGQRVSGRAGYFSMGGAGQRAWRGKAGRAGDWKGDGLEEFKNTQRVHPHSPPPQHPHIL